MDKPGDRRTRDFMNVESFSQLPLIRPAAAKDKPVRLFGIEFAGGGGKAHDDPSQSSNNHSSSSIGDRGQAAARADHGSGDNHGNSNTSSSNSSNGNNSRRFECHYCCRNFPTSQALGGHQNAHKRERQQAKRIHLHSAMAHHHHADLLGFRASSSNYPSWTATTSYASHGTRLYGSPCAPRASSVTTINGSPLGLWKLPPSSPHSSYFSTGSASNCDRLPTLHSHSSFPLIGSDKAAAGSTSPASYLYDKSKPSAKDHVSLDLHL